MVQQPIAVSIFDVNLRQKTIVLVSLTILALAFAIVPAAHAQTFTVLHNFTGGSDGANPLNGLTIDAAGNLYGTASAGGLRVSGCENYEGTYGCGTVFEMKPSGSGWVLTPLYEFPGGANNSNPSLGVVFGPDGALYGVAGTGLYRLAPGPTRCASFLCSWQENLLYTFQGQPDASDPSSRVIFDSTGNMYGVSYFGGTYNDGAIFQVTHPGSGWTESVIHSFNSEGGESQGLPEGSLVIDHSGDLYGTTDCSATLGCFWGAVWELQPSQSGWNLTNPYQWGIGQGYQPVGVISDSAGNLYGTDFGDGGSDIPGAIYELSPSGGGWNYTQLYGYPIGDLANGLVMDSAGNLYGGDFEYGYGYIFKLSNSGNGWTFTTLHTFSQSDGEFPQGPIVIDKKGNLYGTTIKGGLYGYGVVWEITPD
jgi:uncharacterized repeat protein (TIGR03803 family)